MRVTIIPSLVALVLFKMPIQPENKGSHAIFNHHSHMVRAMNCSYLVYKQPGLCIPGLCKVRIALPAAAEQ